MEKEKRGISFKNSRSSNGFEIIFIIRWLRVVVFSDNKKTNIKLRARDELWI